MVVVCAEVSFVIVIMPLDDVVPVRDIDAVLVFVDVLLFIVVIRG